MAIQNVVVKGKTVHGDSHVNFVEFTLPNPYTTGGGDVYTAAQLGMSSLKTVKLETPVFDKAGVRYEAHVDETNKKIKVYVGTTGVEAAGIDLSGVTLKLMARGGR